MGVQSEIVECAKPLAIGILDNHSFQNGELMVSPRLGVLIGPCRTHDKKKAGENPRDAHSHEKSIGQTRNRLNRLFSPVASFHAHPDGFGPVMVRYRSAIHAGADTWFVTINRVGHQNFAIRIREFGMRNRKIKEWHVALIQILNGINLSQRLEWSHWAFAGSHQNILSLVAGHTESGGREQIFPFDLA